MAKKKWIDVIKLDKGEIDEFLKNNRHGTLSFAGDQPYALPMGYTYAKGTVLMGVITTGRKMKCLRNSNKVCYTVCKPRWETPKMKDRCTSLVIEGTLEEVKNRADYGFKSPPLEGMQLYRIKVTKMGARRCNRRPCEFDAQIRAAAEKEKSEA